MGILLFLIIGPPIIFFVLGILMAVKKDKRAKIFFILLGVYLLVALGTCGIMLSNFTLDTK